MQIVSEAEDFAISHRYMLLEQSFMNCHQKESVHHQMYAIWQKKVDLHHDKKNLEGLISVKTVVYNTYGFKD